MKKSFPPQLAPNVKLGKQAPKGPRTPAMKKQKDPPALAKIEEKDHQDVDGDGEKGEPASHVKKVFGGKPKPVSPKDKATIKKMCAACKKAGKKNCSHM